MKYANRGARAALLKKGGILLSDRCQSLIYSAVGKEIILSGCVVLVRGAMKRTDLGHPRIVVIYYLIFDVITNALS